MAFMTSADAFGEPTPEMVVDLLMGVLRDGEPTPAQVAVTVDRFLVGPFHSLATHRQAIIDDVLKRIRVRVGIASVLSDDGDHMPWLSGSDRTAWAFWPRLRRYQAGHDRLAPAQLNELDRSTDATLEQLESPHRNGQWDRRGLVVGHVQSGKTSHYTALTAKALDAGYQIVIILAGVHNSLRAQTHERIDRYLIGRDSTALLEALKHGHPPESGARIGVAAFDQKQGHNDPVVSILTCTNSTDAGDFKKDVATTIGLTVGQGSRLVMVIKKNATILGYLCEWLPLAHGATNKKNRIAAPTLVIDDEADHASINTKNPDDDPTTINSQIRRLLKSFDRVGFVGYTATPFANIFIPVEVSQTQMERLGPDLFPRSFIVNLKPPSDYVGPNQVFGHAGDESIDIPERPGLPMHVGVTDEQSWLPDKHKKDQIPGALPHSLCDAIRLFVLVCSARAARGDANVHNSMLIHATRFVNVQAQVAEQVEEELNGLKNILGFGTPATAQAERQRLEGLWRREILEKHEQFRLQLGEACLPVPSWDDVWTHFQTALNRIIVMRVNGTSADALKYSKSPDGLYAIAIGGDKLSRGLTLEGLSVSYFLRTSNMFDTLLQMGRWFGYRPRYADLCRVFTTPALHSAFREIALAMEDLRADLDRMADTKATPLEFGLRVRTPQDGLLITAANKIRHGDPVQVRFANSLVQTLDLPDGENAQDNREAVRGLVSVLGTAKREVRGEKTAHFLWPSVPVSTVNEFLSKYEAANHASFGNRCAAIRKYIGQQVEKGELVSWTVVIVSKQKSDYAVRLGPYDINLVERGRYGDKGVDGRLRMRGVVGSEEEALDLDEDQYKLADDQRASKAEDALKFREAVRQLRAATQGLLLIYPIHVKDEPIRSGDDFVPAVGVSFPASATAKPMSYTVNEIWRQRYGLSKEPDDAD